MADSLVTVLEKAVIRDDLNNYECPIRMPEAHCQHGGHPTQIKKKKAQDWSSSTRMWPITGDRTCRARPRASFQWAGSCLVCINCLWGPTANPTLWGLEFIPLLPQRSNSSGNSGLTCDILFSRKVSSQSLRCAVLFIVKIPQSIREPAALPVQVMFKKGKPMGFVVQYSAVEVAECCQQRII